VCERVLGKVLKSTEVVPLTPLPNACKGVQERQVGPGLQAGISLGLGCVLSNKTLSSSLELIKIFYTP